MIYQKDSEIVKAYRAAGLTRLDLANLLQLPPGTIASKLGGYCTPFDTKQRKIILAYCEQVSATRAQVNK